MAHPRTYDDADPLLDRLRTTAVRLPRAVEVEAGGHPTSRTRSEEHR